MHASKYNLLFKPKPLKKHCVTLNLLSGAIDVMHEDLAKLLLGNEDSKFFPAEGRLIRNLIDRGYVFTNREEEETEIMKRYQECNEMKFGHPGYHFLIPAYSCNLRCVYCFQRGYSSTNDLITHKMIGRAIGAMSALGGNANPIVCLYGGEPLIMKREQFTVIREILQKTSDQGYELRIYTNGHDLIHYCDMIANFDVGMVQVTIDGVREVHDARRIKADGTGSFDQISLGIEAALERGINLGLLVNVDEQNITRLPELADFMIERGWVGPGKPQPHVSTVEDFSCRGYKHHMPRHLAAMRLLQLWKKFKQTTIFSAPYGAGIEYIRDIVENHRSCLPRFEYCVANTNQYCFDLFGDVYTCPVACGIKELSVGRFYPELRMDYDRLNQWRNRSILTMTKCRECSLALVCGGGCGYLALVEKGSLQEPYCTLTLDTLACAMNYYFPMLEKGKSKKKHQNVSEDSVC